jgi:hypothetical protein
MEAPAPWIDELLRKAIELKRLIRFTYAVMKVNKNLMARIWKEADLKPHRLEPYMASNDLAFEEKAAAIIGLYLNPPQNAAVFCVDEKSAIPALDRLDRRLPLSPGRAEKHGFEYYRHGTLSLYAALNPQTGEVIGQTAARHTSQELSTSWKKSSRTNLPGKRFMSSWTTSQPTKRIW